MADAASQSVPRAVSFNLAEPLARAGVAALVGAVVAGSAFMLNASGRVTRAEMVDHVDREVQPVEARLGTIETLQREQLIQQATIETKLDLLLNTLGPAPEGR